MLSLKVEHPAEALREALFPYRPPFVAIIRELLAPAECEQLVRRIEAIGLGAAPINAGMGRMVMRPDVRNNDRVMFDDVTLAAALFDRMRAALPVGPVHQGRREWGEPCGLNERFRGYRYTRGQRFAPHFDGSFERDRHERSELTVLLYLNEGYGGGATRFNDLELDVVPTTGMALLFDHSVLHEGCVLESGTKYVLRSDVMYRGAVP